MSNLGAIFGQWLSTLCSSGREFADSGLHAGRVRKARRPSRSRRTRYQTLETQVEAVEPRLLLSGLAADVPVGTYSLSNNDHAPVQIGVRQGAQTADVREVLWNADERTPNLNTLAIEIGPYDQYVGDDDYYEYSPYPFSFSLETRAYGKTGISYGGVDATLLSLGGFTHAWAEAYDAEANLYNLGNVSGALPSLYSQGFADDFHDFVPDLLTTSTTTTPHTYSNTDANGRTLNVTATHTIVRTIDGSGNWTFTETIGAVYDFDQFTTNWQEPTDYDVYGSYASYGWYTWG